MNHENKNIGDCNFSRACFLAYCIGKKAAGPKPTHEVNSIHFLNPRYVRRFEPSFQFVVSNILRDRLKKMRRPFSEKRIDSVIDNVESITMLKNFMRVIKVHALDYKIIVSNNDADPMSSYFLITRDSLYFMRPLHIIYDLKLNRPDK